MPFNKTFGQLSHERAIIIKHLLGISARWGLFIPCRQGLSFCHLPEPSLACDDWRILGREVRKYVLTTKYVIHLPIAFTIINIIVLILKGFMFSLRWNRPLKTHHFQTTQPLDVCSLYTNIPQEEGMKLVCQYYNEHYQPNSPIPRSTLGDRMKPLLEGNLFHFNEKKKTSCKPAV